MTLEDRITQLVAICRENADSYRRAAEMFLTEPAIAHFFEEQAENRDQAATTIENKLIRSGKRPSAAILIAPPSEGWGRPAADDTNPRAIIEACHAAEERALVAFDEGLKTLPDDWRWELNEYAQHIRSAIAKLHAWLEQKEIGPEFWQQRTE